MRPKAKSQGRVVGILDNPECKKKLAPQDSLHYLCDQPFQASLDGHTFPFVQKTYGTSNETGMRPKKASAGKRLQAERLASLGRLSAGLAHEINNPLGLILGYTQLMLKEAKPGDQFHEDLRIVEKHARNCKKIVEDLIKFSRSTETSKILANMNDLLNEVLLILEPRFETKGIVVVKRFDPALPRISVDPNKIKQAFMNLLINAEQAIEEEGKITVTTSCDGRRRKAVFSVKDTGCGISPEIMHKIFDPFFTTRSTGQGTGLGLAVGYGIIRDHEGEIRVRSTIGKGSTFTVRLPLDERRGRKKGEIQIPMPKAE
jgi:two-component system, NtrC family, sensor kinase